MREEAALRHAQVVGQAADGQRLEPDAGREAEGTAENRLSRELAFGGHGRDQNSTNVRILASDGFAPGSPPRAQQKEHADSRIVRGQNGLHEKTG